jgi:hypothetical protein
LALTVSSSIQSYVNRFFARTQLHAEGEVYPEIRQSERGGATMTRGGKILASSLITALVLTLLTIISGRGVEVGAPTSSPGAGLSSSAVSASSVATNLPSESTSISVPDSSAPSEAASTVSQMPLPSASEHGASETEYWAVLAGVSDYKYLEDTKWNDNDATALYQQLCRFWGEDHVKLLVNAEATQTGIEAALVDWLDPRESKEDVVLFFFAGHSDSGRYMLPHDSLETSYARDITGSLLDNWLDKLDSENLVVMLETCESGAFLADLSEPGRVIITSSSKGEDSWGYGALGRFVFAYYLMEALSNPEAVDSDRNYVVSAEEIFAYVEPEVTSYGRTYGDPQHPQLFDGYEGELGLIRI